MAWTKIIFNELYYRIGLTGTEYRLDGTKLPPMRGNAESELQAHAGTNYDYLYYGTFDQYHPYDSPSSLRFLDVATIGSGNGLNWIDIYNNMSNDEVLYIYRTKGDPSVSFAMKKDTIRNGFNCGSYYYGTLTIDNSCVFYIRNVPSSGIYPLSIQTSSENLGFLFSGTKYTIYYSLAFSSYEENYYNIFFEGTSDNISNILVFLLTGNTPPPPSTDPYGDGGYSTDTTSGTGSFDATSEAVSEPSTPSVSPMVGNFINQYVVSQTALSNFGAWLWGGGSIFDDLQKLFQSPIEAVVNVGILPFEPDYDEDNYDTIKVGGLSSTASGHLIQDNYFTLDCGTITFDPYYGSALDQNPYTKCEIYLPYCGVYPLNVDEIMGHTISLKYFCDTLSGDCVAVISDEERVLEQVRGNVFVQIPFSAKDFTSVYTSAINGAISIAASAATVYATGGLSAPVAVGAGTSIAANALNSKTHVTRAGGFSGMAGLMSVQTPYVILTIPNQCLPDHTNSHQGYPCMVTKRLGDFTGFTKVYEIHLDGLDCTDAESKEIYELLKGGVIL